jgi:hypothetical protein
VKVQACETPRRGKDDTIPRTEMCQSVFCHENVNDHAVKTVDSNPVADVVAYRRKKDKELMTMEFQISLYDVKKRSTTYKRGHAVA